MRRAVISSPRRADPSSAVSTLRCSLAFSPASLRLLSSRSSRLLSRSAVPGLGAGRAGVTTHSPSPFPQGRQVARVAGRCAPLEEENAGDGPSPTPEGPQALARPWAGWSARAGVGGGEGPEDRYGSGLGSSPPKLSRLSGSPAFGLPGGTQTQGGGLLSDPGCQGDPGLGAWSSSGFHPHVPSGCSRLLPGLS